MISKLSIIWDGNLCLQSVYSFSYLLLTMGKSYKNNTKPLTKGQKLAVRNYHSKSPSEQKAFREELIRSGSQKVAARLRPSRTDFHKQKIAEQRSVREEEEQEQMEQAIKDMQYLWCLLFMQELGDYIMEMAEQLSKITQKV